MIKSMTGYGKAECSLSNVKIIIEVRSLNGKNADINIKTQLIPRDKEIEIRQLLAERLHRGTIDLFANYEQNGTENTKSINRDVFKSYYNQVVELLAESNNIFPIELEKTRNELELTSAILKLPDIVETKKQELSEVDWQNFSNAIAEAIASLDKFREKEGTILYADVTKRVALIESYVKEVEKYENERTEAIKERIKSRIAELQIQPDENRLEQEIIFYIEKLDINEEKVRLRQHCKYFMETIDKESYPGKKLGFIAQEMGREINTMGSKANHAQIQQWVVKMKDELEKIKEQSLNIL
jgi:uncharacterized protein (TIGR00255 family)